MRLALPLLLSALLLGSSAAALARADAPTLPLWKMSTQQADRYIARVHDTVPELRKRIAIIGRQNIGQPYSLNLLGEYPYQLHDTLPMFSL